MVSIIPNPRGIQPPRKSSSVCRHVLLKGSPDRAGVTIERPDDMLSLPGMNHNAIIGQHIERVLIKLSLDHSENLSAVVMEACDTGNGIIRKRETHFSILVSGLGFYS